MPTGNPLVGEVWETVDPTGRTIRGVVADISLTILTLVSFTGNRFRISPSRMVETWRFSQAPPNTALRCSRRGCAQPGTLRIVNGSTPEWLCPRHLPVGVQATLTTESIGTARPPPEPEPSPHPRIIDAEFETPTPPRCYNCQNPDPIEDQRVRLPPLTFLWVCPRCSERWCDIEAQWAQDGTLASHALVDVRAALVSESYSIQAVMVAYGARTVLDGMFLSAENGVWDGIPIERAALGDNTVFRLRLRGGPELRAPRQHALATHFTMAYGRGPGGLVASTPIPRDVPMVETPAGRIDLSPIVLQRTVLAPESDATELLDAMAPSPFISAGTRWVNRASGEIVEVSRMGRSDDRGETVVHFKRVSDDLEANMVLLQRDFETMFRPFGPEVSKKAREAVVEVLKDEEWEHIESTEAVTIDSVDTKRNLVIVLGRDQKRRSVPMLDFVNAKWRKIIRKTAYQRLMEDD